MSSVDDVVSKLADGNQNMSKLITVIQAIFPRVTGTFTLNGTATTTISQAAVKANAVVWWTPTNAAAGTIEGSAKKLFLASVTAATNFVVTTSNAGTTAGTETFQYVVFNPS